ncbi:MAG: hypothetical protein JWQ30_590 [Sediminibacterium sp.]|nr:hypothetical protein [Sediminibacterium sp.]
MHILAWALLFSLPVLLTSSHTSENPQAVKDEPVDIFYNACMNTWWILMFYFNAYRIIPRFLYTKKYWGFALVQAIILVTAYVLSVTLFHFLSPGKIFASGPNALFTSFTFLFIIAASTAYRFVADKLKDDKLKSEKENSNLKTELSLLRSQVSPHFMFNVLNNMVALARKRSDLLEPSLIKLSSLMRYMLYESDGEKVFLDRETEYLQSYIDLQQQRFGNKVKITVDFATDKDSYRIEPMLLIPFVENAFKHGTGLIENPYINIRLQAKENLLFFSVSNRYHPGSQEIKDKTSGIGLTNVKRRLSLLYGRLHNLQVTDGNAIFLITLQINLS